MRVRVKPVLAGATSLAVIAAGVLLPRASQSRAQGSAQPIEFTMPTHAVRPGRASRR